MDVKKNHPIQHYYYFYYYYYLRWRLRESTKDKKQLDFVFTLNRLAPPPPTRIFGYI